MNLHEYQAKALFAEYGLPVTPNVVLESVEQVEQGLRDLGGDKWVAKVQIHAGGRGKAGGVKVVESADEARAFAKKWLGQSMSTYQTGDQGRIVNKILIEGFCAIERELYLGAVVDRGTNRVVFMGSSEGGVDIEKTAAERPEKISRAILDPLTGAQPFQGRRMAFDLGLSGGMIRQFSDIFTKAAALFMEKDFSLLEINPMIIDADGKLLCADAKINIDANALFRHPELADMRDLSQEDEREAYASKVGLNYVSLDGNIGCMVNGAGLAMGTMDMIKLSGGAPANFLDVGGGATRDQVSEAFKLVLSDEQVRVVLINIFGGIVRCDLIAEGIVAAAREVGVELPVVVRLQGNNAEKGAEILQMASGINIVAASDLTQAAAQAVELAA